MRVPISFEKGVISDTPAMLIPDGAASDARHIRFEDGVAKNIGGRAVYYTTTAEDYIITAIYGYKPASNLIVFLGSKDTLATITDGSARAEVKTGLTGSDTQPMSLSAFGSVMLMANGADALQKIVSPYTASANVGGSPPVAKVVKTFQRHVMLMGVASYPVRVQWSDIDDYETWTAASDNEAGSIDLYESKTAIVGGEVLGDYFVVYTGNQIHVFQYIGGTYVFSRRIACYDIGLLAQNLVASTGDGHFFMSDQDFHYFDGMKAYPIGTERIKRTVYGSINTTYKSNAFAFPILDKKEVWFCVPTGANTTPTLAAIFNYYTNTWSLEDIAWTAGADRLPATYPIIAKTSDKKSYSIEYGTANNDGASGISTYVVSKEYGWENPETVKYINRLYPIIESTASAISFYIGYRANVNASVTWSSAYTFTPASDYKVDIRESGRLWRIKIATTAASSPWAVHKVIADIQDVGKQ